MNTIYLKDGIKTNKTVVAVGSFDGVHKGHAELIKKAVATAEATGALPAVWTFSDYIPGPASKHIIPAEKRMQIFKEHGVAVVFTCEFDSVRDMSADGTMQQLVKLAETTVDRRILEMILIGTVGEDMDIKDQKQIQTLNIILLIVHMQV